MPNEQNLPRPDKFEEACGVFGIFARDEDVARLTYFGLHALQHRGQESAGIAVSNHNKIKISKALGLVPQVFDEKNLHLLDGHIAIGHVRYSTTGSNSEENAQPILKHSPLGDIALAHNGNLVNTAELHDKLSRAGYTFETTSDTELLATEILDGAVAGGSIMAGVKRVLDTARGAYSAVLLTKDELIGFRDEAGVRPLVIGKVKDAYVIASETCGLDIIGAEFVRDVLPGEIVIIDDAGLRSEYISPAAKCSLCVFEYIYFARPDSKMLGTNLYDARKKMGMILAEESPVDADIVIGVPDSGTPAAIGYAQQSGIPYGEGLIKNRYVGRTFIQPNQTIRTIGIRLKLNPLREAIEGKRVVVVDDSIVRGSTSEKIVRMLKQAGAKSVHMRISSPPVKYPCFYGIDTADSNELIAHVKNVSAIQEHLGADSLAYLSYDGLVKATGNPRDKFCLACFDGCYPVEIPSEVKLSKLLLEKVK